MALVLVLVQDSMDLLAKVLELLVDSLELELALGLELVRVLLALV